MSSDFMRVKLDLFQLTIDEPLQPAVEENFPFMFGGKLPDCVALGIAVLLWPVRPDPKVRILSVQVLVERAVCGIQAQ